MKVASRWTREMVKDYWAALRVPFEVSGYEFQVKPVNGMVCFSPSMVSCLGGDAGWVKDWVEVWPRECTEWEDLGDGSSHEVWNESE